MKINKGYKNLITKKRIILYTALIIIITCLPYLNSFDCGFQLDDYHTIQKSKTIGDIERFTDINIWGGLFYNRQLVNLTYTINYIIHSYDLFGYHLFNLLVHIINSLLVFYFIRNIFETDIIKKNKIYQHKELIALFTSIIFAVHPIQIQAVTYITQRLVSIAVMFYLLGMNLYLKARLNPSSKNVIKYFLIVLCFLLGIYSKEIIYTFPIALLFLELLFFRDTNNKLNLRFVLPILSIIGLGLLLFFIKIGIPIQPGAPKPYNYFLSELTVLITYLRLLLIPINQHLYYFVQVRDSLFDISVLFSISVLISIILIGIYFYKKNRLITFAVGWFFISQLIESSIFPLKFLLFEYRVYPSVIGYGLIITLLAFMYIKQSNARLIVLSVVAFVYAILTFSHNYVWKDPITLWTNNVEKTPEYAVAYNNLGKQYMMLNNFPKAYENFNTAIKLDSNCAESYSQRAVILSDNRNFNAAIQDASRAIQLDSTSALNYNNRGYVYQSTGELNKAIKDFNKAIEIEPRYDNAMKNLSVLYYFQNNQIEAMKYANKSIKLDSTKADYYNNRGNIYFAMDDLTNAEKDFRKAIQISPSYAKAINNVGVVMLKQNKLDEAIKYFTRAIQVYDKFIDSYYYRGYSYILKGSLQNAYYDLMQCVMLSPNHQGAISLLNQYFTKK